MSQVYMGGQLFTGVPKTRIKATPDPEVLARNLRKITRGLSDWRPVWHALVPEMLKMTGQHFRTGGASTGSPWPPTKDPGRATMILTGALVRSVTSAGAVRFLNRKAVGIAPTVGRYPFMLHFGAKQAGRDGRSGYPARPFLVWTAQSKRKADQLAEAFVKKQTDKIQTGIAGLV
jgi:phage gpG-like protein